MVAIWTLAGRVVPDVSFISGYMTLKGIHPCLTLPKNRGQCMMCPASVAKWPWRAYILSDLTQNWGQCQMCPASVAKWPWRAYIPIWLYVYRYLNLTLHKNRGQYPMCPASVAIWPCRVYIPIWPYLRIEVSVISGCHQWLYDLDGYASLSDLT